MSPTPALTALYSAAIILWVEDQLTSTYLGECWNDPDIAFRIAGATQGVRAIVSSARQNGYLHVFGFVDRDFGYTNRPRWSDPAASPVFVPEVSEAENYLLDPDHLAGCDLNNGSRTAAEVRTRLLVRAGQMVWWMALRQVLTDLRGQLVQDFPSHSEVRSLADAEQLICNSPWYLNLAGFATTITTPGHVSGRLTAAHAMATTELGNGRWQQTFSGKTLLRDLQGWLYNPPPGAATAPAERDRDLARSVARWQVANFVVPVEVSELRAALRGRVGI
jgi:hypothetical protein